ncbi:MAG: flagellar basal body L-ring protein FlgH [Rhodocyclaceae bacterium]|nr:flagellar basal body L-ring protein FlgH [Rhodocyclaceae bacterium]
MRILLPLLALLLSACSSLEPVASTAIHQPMSVRPQLAPQAAPANGAIYQASQTRPLFEDRRARLLGDTLTINLVESNTAQKASNTSATRESSVSGGITTAAKVPFTGLAGLGLEAGTTSDFTGQGSAAANNQFNGTITVTVVDVYPNGNLLVSGEKQIAINQGNEFIRFSGVVNPSYVTGANTVQSTQVADARIEYKSSGYISESQSMGWLQRFFVAISPF